MDIAGILQRLALKDAAVANKANELLRLANIRFTGGGLGQGEVCKSAVCVELACGLLQLSVDRARIVRFCGAPEKVYANTLAILQGALKIKPKLDIRQLAVQFGCARIVPIIQKTLSTYRERFVASLPEERRAHADFRRPVFLACALYLTARKHKLKVERAKITAAMGVQETEFSQIVESMHTLCYDTIGVTKSKPQTKDDSAVDGKRTASERSEEEGDNGETLGEIAEDQNDNPALKRSKKMSDEQDYEAWKNRVVGTPHPSSTPPQAGAVKSLQKKVVKQGKLSFKAKAKDSN
mmetsp:Transcript_32012/g.38754  ORF Transcript_32012/g.38754 Transcript_32012/m.38754 type:complete len:295 (+) Transcript_32012:361-1245(+)|eukprot:CAMPEP_0197850612 /NCGR_PEP_ID=MMETSP1438-20131217/15883_1 /TAXON_ID=1461541 /ORGANISM="Pterosperma sp., Strain CCMP1384" /LENGTH=294 /DNA_ID=CAMNT_0043463867 /DNA_START=360 /DNA_END=1244 /DNA_ORIENTATION=-